MRQVAADKAATGGFGINAGAWFDAATLRIDLMKEVEDQVGLDYAQLADANKRGAWRALTGFALTTVVILLGTTVFAWRMTRGISVQLLGIASTISEGSSELTAAATQVSAASQASAAGANEEAASLQQTVTSLGQVASMTQRNATAATEAKELSAQTRNAADSGAHEMEAMKQAMDDLKASSARIAQVVKSIDEIAFQTNILALNAAVEAARAGEAGAGFAVVAEEVRALAQRSAQAARETAQMIEESVNNSERGVELSARVGRHLAEIVTKAHHVDQLVGEIATASAQQTQGIDHVNGVVAQMDRITQSTAAGAEETAAQAEELNAQAAELTKTVAHLMAIVGGRRANDGAGLPGAPLPNGRRTLDLAAPSGRPPAALVRPVIAAAS
ncbi:MAG: hypothetical protein HZA93_15895 [Verrucomicrobia bacterium]|nr:hypothetical protein [Verrucomicrobiota bacterium]